MSGAVRFEHFEVPVLEDGSLHELGRGAMGITYKAFDTNLRCAVALKVISGTYLDSDVARQRFLREARAAAALRHPNVAAVFHLGEENGTCFYAMEFVDGETLDALLRREGCLPAGKALQITLQVARALGAAEKQGLVHRDIKPSNIMLLPAEDGEMLVKVIDFGLAKSAGAGEETTALTMGGFLGTPHFASPEQLEEKEIDIRSDIYSLGVTLYYMLAGRAPFSGSLAQVMSQHLNREPPLETISGHHPKVVALLQHMLAKDPGHRPQTSADLRREIHDCLEALETGGNPLFVASADCTDFETKAGPVPTEADTLITPAGVPPQAPNPIPPVPLPVAKAAAVVPPPLPPANRPHIPVLIGAVSLLLVIGCIGVAGWFFLGRAKPSPQSNPSPTPVAGLETPAPSPEPTAEPTPAPAPWLAALETITTTPQTPGDRLLALAALSGENPGVPEIEEALRQTVTALEEDFSQNPDILVPELIPALQDASASGSQEAAILVGRYHEPTDAKEAVRWYAKAADAGNPWAMVLAGQALAKNGLDLPGAVAWFQKGADLEDPLSEYLLAECYLHGKGVAEDPSSALELLRKSAGKNQLVAVNALGDLYRRGLPGVLARDPREAFRLFSLAADQGHLPSQANLGVMYVKGEGIDQNPAKAMEIFKTGAQMGDMNCMFFYGLMLRDGQAGNPDVEEGNLWIVKAAKAGHLRAIEECRQLNLPIDP